jgi:RecA-family ATPase
VPDRFPLRNVSLLSGEGSVGKTILLMQLAAAHVLGRGWLDSLPEIGPAIFLNAEDEESELHRRFVDIAKLYDVPLAELKNDLHILALAGQDAVLGHANRNGLIKPTKLFERLTEAARDIKPKFIGLDTSADIFAGNVHSVTADGVEPDKTLRQLEFMKSNYSAPADSVVLRWKEGVFIPNPKPGSLEQIAANAKADEAFMALLHKFIRQGRRVSPAPTSTAYAPKLFEGDGLSRAQLEAAMQRLFDAEKIRAEDHGKPSRPSLHIVPC